MFERISMVQKRRFSKKCTNIVVQLSQYNSSAERSSDLALWQILKPATYNSNSYQLLVWYGRDVCDRIEMLWN